MPPYPLFDVLTRGMHHMWDSILQHIKADVSALSQTPLAVNLSPLAHTTIVTLTGVQSEEYLNSQLTADINTLTTESWLRAAHCNAKGKTLAVYQLAKSTEQVFALSSAGAASVSLPELKKFGVFSQTTIEESVEHVALGISGEKAAEFISETFNATTASCTQIDQGVLLKEADDRWLLILSNDAMQRWLETHVDKLAHESIWNMMQIQAAIPTLTETTADKYVPQMLNLQALNAISFTKGCYMGQETVARMRYLGKNKRAMFLLKGHASETPSAGDSLEQKITGNWRGAGHILNAVSVNNTLWLLAVMPNDTGSETELRIKNDASSSLTIEPLPYELTDE